MPAAASISQGALPKMPNGVANATSAPLVDLLDFSSDDVPAPASSGGDFMQDLLGVDLTPASQANNETQKSGTDALLDLLSIGSPPAQQSSSSMLDILSSGQDNKSPGNILDTLTSPSAPESMFDKLTSPSASSAHAPSPVASSSMMDLLDGFGPSQSVPVVKTNGSTYPPIVAFESSSLKMTLNFSKDPGNPQTTIIDAQFSNKSPDIYSNFVFQAAVPKFLQLHLEPASSNTLPASGSVTQKLRISNSQQGKKSLVMRLRINYKVNEKDVLEEGQVSNFPRGL